MPQYSCQIDSGGRTTLLELVQGCPIGIRGARYVADEYDDSVSRQLENAAPILFGPPPIHVEPSALDRWVP